MLESLESDERFNHQSAIIQTATGCTIEEIKVLTPPSEAIEIQMAADGLAELLYWNTPAGYVQQVMCSLCYIYKRQHGDRVVTTYCTNCLHKFECFTDGDLDVGKI